MRRIVKKLLEVEARQVGSLTRYFGRGLFGALEEKIKNAVNTYSDLLLLLRSSPLPESLSSLLMRHLAPHQIEAARKRRERHRFQRQNRWTRWESSDAPPYTEEDSARVGRIADYDPDYVEDASPEMPQWFTEMLAEQQEPAVKEPTPEEAERQEEEAQARADAERLDAEAEREYPADFDFIAALATDPDI